MGVGWPLTLYLIVPLCLSERENTEILHPAPCQALQSSPHLNSSPAAPLPPPRGWFDTLVLNITMWSLSLCPLWSTALKKGDFFSYCTTSTHTNTDNLRFGLFLLTLFFSSHCVFPPVLILFFTTPAYPCPLFCPAPFRDFYTSLVADMDPQFDPGKRHKYLWGCVRNKQHRELLPVLISDRGSVQSMLWYVAWAIAVIKCKLAF